PSGGVRPALAAAAGYSSGRTWLTLDHSISEAISRNSGRLAVTFSLRAASDRRLIFESSTAGGAPPPPRGLPPPRPVHARQAPAAQTRCPPLTSCAGHPPAWRRQPRHVVTAGKPAAGPGVVTLGSIL